MNSPQSPRKMGTRMFILAWLVILLLLAMYFSERLGQQHNPNQTPTSQYHNGQIEVVLHPNRQHHYLVNGQINGREVTFLLDTGATDVAIPGALAKQLGLQRGQRLQIYTANGPAIAYSTRIDRLQIADIRLNDIRASIAPGMNGNLILLGMSALRELEFSQTGDSLILRQ